jgi:aminoglycoside phosphotransferase family enzyme/predicted kinase
VTDPYAAIAETHISTVFFAGDRAYKLLKPVRTGFLDNSTAAQREVACRREVELNRRFAPDVYLGVSEIRENGIVADHLIVMRRQPSDRRLTRLLATSERDDAVRQVARAVAVIHAAQPPDARAAELARRDAVGALWQHNFTEMESFVGPVLDPEVFAEIRSLVTEYVAGRDALFEARIADGFARDGHGDLLADDIFCLPDGPRVLDCLAFDDDLRLGDVLLDVAFLVMDLERQAGPDVAAAFLRWYQEFSNEHHPQSLADHYVAYRALVRAKINCIRAGQGAQHAARDAASFLAMSLGHLRAARCRLVIVGGAPGTGKSTTARGLCAATGYSLLTSDEVRKDLAGIGHDQHAFAGLGEGIYEPSMSDRVYAALVARAQILLGMGESVVIDASWTTAKSRDAAREAALAARAEIVEFRCVLDPEIAAARIERRLRDGNDLSDATPAIARSLAAGAAPWPEALDLDTSASDEHAVVDHALELLQPPARVS